MLQLTQGHPAVLQIICRYMVAIANSQSRKNMTFWTEFCHNYQCHKTVEQILNQQPISDKKNLSKLKNYGYIIADGDNWKIRMPLLEMWLEEYREGC